jgi:L-asparaginase / beta-aspartyl-peptidase
MTGRILVHGGAGPWLDAGRRKGEVIPALEKAVSAGLSAMQGGSAVEAVVEAITILEGSGVFNAGKGAVLNLEGEMELDAGIMDGELLRAGGVAAVRSVPHPIRLARVVMEKTGHVLVVGTGAGKLAEHFALSGELHPSAGRLEEFEKDRRDYLQSGNHRWARDLGSGFAGGTPADTVGAVAMDGEGRFAAATSTGGLPFKLPGRVGDSPVVGHGYYALRGAGAASTSGIGEAISRYGLSLRAVELMAGGAGATSAARETIADLTRLFGPDTAGIILLDRTGSPGVFFNTGGMAIGYGGADIGPKAQIVRRQELEKFSEKVRVVFGG